MTPEEEDAEIRKLVGQEKERFIKLINPETCNDSIRDLCSKFSSQHEFINKAMALVWLANLASKHKMEFVSFTPNEALIIEKSAYALCDFVIALRIKQQTILKFTKLAGSAIKKGP